MILAAAAALAVAACSPQVRDTGEKGGGPGDPPPPPPGGVVLLTPPERLVRAAMALKGTRPTLAELDAVHADPSALAGIVDAYTDSPEFLETIRDLHAEDFLVRTDRFTPPAAGGLDGLTGSAINASLTEEPLRLIEHVVAADRPYTEIVTADYTVADPIVSAMWGVPHDGNGEWKVTEYDDGRPRAGILSSTGLFARHETNGRNYNRGRANMITRTLVCFDFAAADVNIDVSIDLSDPGAVENAVRNNPACQTCHADLDPIAGFFFGWEDRVRNARLRDAVELGQNPYPLRFYFPGREAQWETTTGVRPKWFGANGDDLQDLGELIAADPAFASCAAERFYGYLSNTERAEVPAAVVEFLAAGFVTSGFDAKALARDAVLLDTFNVSHGGSEETAQTLDGFKRARPEQLGRLIADLTGFTWRTDASFNQSGYAYGTVDVVRNDTIGMRTLAGGIDSTFVTSPSRSWNSTTSLFLRTFAANAAGFVVDADFAIEDPQARKLLSGVEAGTQDEDAVRAQLATLHARIFGERVSVDSADVDDGWVLFSASLASHGDPPTAWKTTLTAMLQDIRVAYY